MSEGQLKKRSLMDLTISEMEELGIKLSDIFSLEGATINLSWEKAIKVVNYLSGTVILTKSSTALVAMEAMGNFL